MKWPLVISWPAAQALGGTRMTQMTRIFIDCQHDLDHLTLSEL